MSCERFGNRCSPRSFTTGIRLDIIVHGDSADGLAIRQLAQ